jgi:hypothetical protein
MVETVMMSRSIPLLMLCLGAAGCGAARAEVASVGPSTVRPIDPRRVGGEYVQAGTSFAVTMDQTIDTQVSAPGMPFTATVAAPLVAPDGVDVVARGAKVHGTVTSVGSFGEPLVRIDIQSVDTQWGPASIVATVRRAQHTSYAGRPYLAPSSSLPLEDGHLYTYDFYTYGTPLGPAPYPPAPPVYGAAVERPREIRIARGATLDLVLTRALIAPGTRVH